MAKTAQQLITIKEPTNLTPFPVASGETIYQGTFAAVTAGYLANLDSGNYTSASIVGIVSDGSDNTGGAAATTANGSISGTYENESVPAGDKTVRNVYLNGVVKVTGAGFAQTSVGKTCYLSDNYTGNITGTGAKLGTITTYISSTVVYVDMNKYYNNDGTIVALIPLVASVSHAAGDMISWTPAERVYLLDFILDVTTPATGAASGDFGIAANGTTTSDILIDGLDIGTAAVFTTAMLQLIAGTGNAAGSAVIEATEYITSDATADSSGLVGTARAIYIKA